MDVVLAWAPSLPELKIRVETIAHNCNKLNITLSRKKFAIGRSLPFTGYIEGEDGVRPDLVRVEAITPFPAPKTLTATDHSWA